ncbi:diacylglycerol/lipid kinase family protein [Ramlibacter alkalitolerans]|uniref:Diacylglycerol kinase n=1 Tax=Ramlibacter alkalitolerans TaxID=2039631 RepID=A0ABS1JJX9_9BURK|nr:diacylglycerol kinase family protein [Ramlibacter alkalitolerans]MBL0424532.1 diacylglycerol kinase [Ramlibacter alkalitolerans]
MAAVLSDPDQPDGQRAGLRPDAELFIVMNRGSGKNEKDEVRAAIAAQLEAAGRPHRFVPVAPGEILQACQEAARLAREHGGILVAAGGDGTMNCAAQAALAQDCPMGVVAQGTFNLFARQLGLPLDAGEAARALLNARPEPVQVGWVNQRTFLVNASVGLYPKLLADREIAKQKLGRRRWIAMLAALKSLLEWRAQLVLDTELDGHLRQMRTASVFVCNNRLQLQRVGIEEEVVAQVGEGRLAGLLVRGTSAWAKLRMLVAAAFGKLAAEPEIDSFTLRTLTVGARHVRRLKVATDGEITWMQVPLRFTVAPRPLQVMLPPPDQRLPVK